MKNILKAFYLKNIFSFQDELKIDFTFNKNRYFRSIFVLGKNNVGKTNLLKSIKFFRDVTIENFDKGLKNINFSKILFWHYENKNSNIELEIRLFDGKNDYIYGYVIDSKSKIFINEYLYIGLNVNSLNNSLEPLEINFKPIFEVERSKNDFEIFELKKFQKEAKHFLKIEKDKLLLPFLKNMGDKYSKVVFDMIEKITYLEINDININSNIIDFLVKNNDKKAKIVQLMRDFDLSIKDFKIIKFEDDDRTRFATLVDLFDKRKFSEEIDEKKIINNKIKNLINQIDVIPSILSSDQDNMYVFKIITVDNQEIDLINQSDGTIKFLQLITYFFIAEKENKILIIDEFDSGFHKVILEKIINNILLDDDEFAISMLIATHYSDFLDNNNLNLRQVILLNRNDTTLSSSIIYLNKVKMKTDMLLSKKYSEGLISGTPDIIGTPNIF